VGIENQRAVMRLGTKGLGAHGSIRNILPASALVRVAVTVAISVSLMLGGPPQPSAPANNSGNSQDPLHRDSPQSSVVAFLEAFHARDYVKAAKYLDLRKFPRPERMKTGAGLAQQLGQVLDRDSQFDVADLSRDTAGNQAGSSQPNRERVDAFTINGHSLDLDLDRVQLHSGLAVWLFSGDSVEHIPQLARMTSDSPVERYLPDTLVYWSFLDMSLWRWIALALLAVLVGGLSKLLSPLVRRLGEPALKRIAPRINWSLVEGLLAPLQLVFAVAVFRAGIEWIGPSALVRLYLERGVALLFFLSLAWLGMRIVDLIIKHLAVALQSNHQSFSYSVLPLASRVVKMTILLLMIAAVLSNWGYNTTTIVAGLGVGGIAIALAAQKTIENFFGGVAVVSDRPVAVGDFCKFGDRMGTVEDIGLRSTRIRTLDRTLVTVPNGQFSSMTLENFDQRDKMLFHFTLNLRRDTKPDQVRALLAAITKTLAEHPKLETGPIPVRFVGVGTYSLDLEIFAHVQTRNGDEFMQIQQDLYLWILDAVETAGTALALPTQASISYSNEDVPKPNGASPRRRQGQLAAVRTEEEVHV
jgi:MscS family membrane protein